MWATSRWRPRSKEFRRVGAAAPASCRRGGSSQSRLPCNQTMTAFADLGLSEPTLQALQDVGYEQPSPIQEQAIPPLLQGQDIIGQAQTGSGKTAAFGLPMVEHVDPTAGEVQALVLTPTRELCIQVTQALRTYGARKGIDVVAVFGGAPIRTPAGAAARRRPHRRRDRRPRARPHLARVAASSTTAATSSSTRPTRCSTSASWRTSRRSSTLTPNSRQTALFSATMPPRDPQARRPLPLRPRDVKVKSANLTVDSVEQFQLEVKTADKAEKLVEVLRAERPDQAIVFVRTKIRTDQLYRKLRDKGHERQGAARRHEPGLARRRDAGLQGRPRADPRRHRRRRPRPGHLDRHPRRELRRPDVARTSTCTASAARAASGARAARSPSSSRARSSELEAIEKHIGTAIAPWSAGRARRAGAQVEERPRRHTKPQLVAQRRRAVPRRSSRAPGGPTASRSPTSSTRSPTRAGLDGEAVRDVRVLERFSLFVRPRRRGRRGSSTRSTGPSVNGATLRLEPLRPEPVRRLRRLARSETAGAPVKLLEAEPDAGAAGARHRRRRPGGRGRGARAHVRGLRRRDGRRPGLVPELRRPPRPAASGSARAGGRRPRSLALTLAARRRRRRGGLRRAHDDADAAGLGPAAARRSPVAQAAPATAAEPGDAAGPRAADRSRRRPRRPRPRRRPRRCCPRPTPRATVAPATGRPRAPGTGGTGEHGTARP